MVFLGRFDGILVKPFFEQSTMAPSLAQVHWIGHDAFTKTGPDTIEIAAKIQKNCEHRKENRTDFCIFSVQPSCFAMVVFFFNHIYNNSLHFYSHSWNNFLCLDVFTIFFTDFRSGFQPFWFNEKSWSSQEIQFVADCKLKREHTETELTESWVLGPKHSGGGGKLSSAQWLKFG